jgi:hypothetical protein
LEDFIFREGHPGPDYKFNVEQAVFNLYEHRLLQRLQGWISFYAADQKQKAVVAIIHFNVDEGVARSPLRSVFGSLEFSDRISASKIFEFLQFIERQLYSKGVHHIVIKNPPQLYCTEKAALLYTFFFNLKYQVTNAEAGAVIVVKKNFAEALHAWEKRKLRQAHSAGLVFRQIDVTRIEEVYNFIATCRGEKNYDLSMTVDQLVAAVKKFNDRYILFGVFNKHELVSACIAIKVKEKILYGFYTDHAEVYNHLSPVVLLMEGMHAYCVQHTIELLDLGTSAINGSPNFGLLDFKMHLGATPTIKLTVEKRLR